MEEMPKGECLDVGITASMRATAKAKVVLYRGKFPKYTTVVNPKLGK
jgi:hypothetical protein